jgi:hypothetical protein
MLRVLKTTCAHTLLFFRGTIASNDILISTEMKLKARNGLSKIFVCICICVCVYSQKHLRMYDTYSWMMLRTIFVSKMQKLTGNQREWCNQELHNFYLSQIIVWGNGLRRVR